jgi:hypothetical protein
MTLALFLTTWRRSAIAFFLVERTFALARAAMSTRCVPERIARIVLGDAAKILVARVIVARGLRK